MSTTAIEWTDKTWNPTTGCHKVSAGCKNCYAETMHARLTAMGAAGYEEPFRAFRCHPDRLDLPRKWRKPAMVFVNSMSDLFHEDCPLEFIQHVFRVMRECPQHTFQVLTKRAARLAELAPSIDWPPNVWMGVSVEDMRVADRVDFLRTVPAAVRFVSAEPLLGSLANLDLSGMDWVIVGGESGKGARPMAAVWARELRDKCAELGVAYFFKQWGAWISRDQYAGTKWRDRVADTQRWGDEELLLVGKKAAGRVLDGRTHDEYPTGRITS